MNFLDRALPLWERGWNVIPIPPGEKGCFFKGWQRLSGKERATRTQLEEWNAKEPRLNVGVMACPKTICILDFDNMETVERILAETGTPAPVTFEVRSGTRGMPHLYFRQNYSSHWLGNCPGSGFDFQYDRKYVVGPGSEIRVKGVLKTYDVVRDVPLLELPGPWAEWMKTQVRKRSVAAEAGEWECLGIGEGRQGALMRFVAQNWKEGVTEEELLTMALAVNEKFGVPKTEGQVKSMVDWIVQKEQIRNVPKVIIGGRYGGVFGGRRRR